MNDAGSLYWYVGRGSGIVAWLLLTASLCLGIALSRRWHSRRIPRLIVDDAHRWLTLTFYLFVGVHIVTIYLDPFTHFSVADVLVPFASSYRPIWMSLGIIAAELGLAIGVSVWVRRWIGYRTWHALHGLAYPIFLISLLHSLGTGSDTKTAWGMALYGGSVVAILAALAWRTVSANTWRKPALAGALLTSAVVLAWVVSGPLAPGWSSASGTPDQLLASSAATPDATVTVATPTPVPIPSLSPDVQVEITGTTQVNSASGAVLLRGQSADPAGLEVAIAYNLGSSDEDEEDEDEDNEDDEGEGSDGGGITGQIQVRTSDHVPVCDGPITGAQDRTLTATCSGYGQSHTVRITFEHLNRQGFSGTMVSDDSGA